MREICELGSAGTLWGAIPRAAQPLTLGRDQRNTPPICNTSQYLKSFRVTGTV